MMAPRMKPEDAATSSALDLSTWLRLLACSNLMLNRLRRNLRHEFGMTLPTFDILAQIARPPLEPTMGELSERLMVSKGSVTDLIERLERRDLVTRRSDPHDGRVQHVTLTARGKRLLERIIPVHDRWIREAMATTDRRTLTELHHALGELKQGLRAAEPRTERSRRSKGNDHDLRVRPTGATP